MVVAVNLIDLFAVKELRSREVEFGEQGRMFWWQKKGGPVNRVIKGGTMIDSNQNEFAGAMPASESAANWSWLIERLPTMPLEILDSWLTDQLVELEADCDDWVTPKSQMLALQNELRDSRS